MFLLRLALLIVAVLFTELLGSASLWFGSLGSAAMASASEPTNGPLKVHATNPRYFADASGKAIYLTGSHCWDNLRDWKPNEFDFDRYLRFMKEKNHNFIRLWAWDYTAKSSWDSKIKEVAPFPWLRTGPGNAFDGRPRFDLTQYNPAYFQRLRQRVVAARDQGVYVAVMFFEAHSLKTNRGNHLTQPFMKANNCNGIDMSGKHAYSVEYKELLEIQEAYLRKVIETVGDLDNVLYDIINEAHPDSTPWQYHLIDFVRKVESGRAWQHPVGMTHFGGKKPNEPLFESPADWISLGLRKYYDDPPAANGKYVEIIDSDHVMPFTAEHPWVWKSFCRGMNVILMDGFTLEKLGNFDRAAHPGTERCRSAMGHTKSYADRIDLAHAVPCDELSSTRYCLANLGVEYLIYQPEPGDFSVDLKSGTYDAEWFDPIGGVVVKKEAITTEGGWHTFAPPLPGDAVLYLVAPQ